MRDEQTGTYWQQISGLAVSGPLAGQRLKLVPADELTFKLWKSEQPKGTVLEDAPSYARDYAPKNWDVEMARVPVVVSFAQAGLKPRDQMLGVQAFGAIRAFPYNAVLKEKLIQDYVGAEPVLVVLGPDNVSVRLFRRAAAGLSRTAQFYRIAEGTELLIDADTGSRWNFRGCAVSGKLNGTCLQQVNAIKDYWFDWRNYNPSTSVYGIRQKVQ